MTRTPAQLRADHRNHEDRVRHSIRRCSCDTARAYRRALAAVRFPQPPAALDESDSR